MMNYLVGASVALSGLSFFSGLSQARAQRAAEIAKIEAELSMSQLRAESARVAREAKMAFTREEKENFLMTINWQQRFLERRDEMLSEKNKIAIKILSSHLLRDVVNKQKEVAEYVFSVENGSLGLNTKIDNLVKMASEINVIRKEKEMEIKQKDLLNTLEQNYAKDVGIFQIESDKLEFNKYIGKKEFDSLQEAMHITLDLASNASFAQSADSMSGINFRANQTNVILQGIRNGLNDYTLYKASQIGVKK